MSEHRFEAETLLEAARRKTGLSDFGGDDFREGLDVLLKTYDTTAGLSEAGRKMNWKRVVQLLSTRLRVEKARHDAHEEHALLFVRRAVGEKRQVEALVPVHQAHPERLAGHEYAGAIGPVAHHGRNPRSR